MQLDVMPRLRSRIAALSVLIVSVGAGVASIGTFGSQTARDSVFDKQAFSPPRYQAGPLPVLPVPAVGGGEVILELAIDREGRVSGVKPLRATPPFTESVSDAVRGWRFTPGGERVKRPQDERESHIAVESKVVVAAVFRRPAVTAPTLGELPANVGAPSLEVAFPVTMVEPPFPPLARDAGVVLVEARVDRNGYVAESTVVRSAPPFDDAARTALSTWRFRPARVRGEVVEAVVYIVFGFPVPIAVM